MKLGRKRNTIIRHVVDTRWTHGATHECVHVTTCVWMPAPLPFSSQPNIMCLDDECVCILHAIGEGECEVHV